MDRWEHSSGVLADPSAQTNSRCRLLANISEDIYSSSGMDKTRTRHFLVNAPAVSLLFYGCAPLPDMLQASSQPSLKAPFELRVSCIPNLFARRPLAVSIVPVEWKTSILVKRRFSYVSEGLGDP